jgi:CRISPR/Cas system-associated exonuclease Cas4 (RecB family)
MIHDFLKEAGLEIVPEVSGEKHLPGLTHPIGFRIDNLFIDPKTGDMDGIEVKTGYGYGIRSIKKDNRPRDGDLMQVVCYLTFGGLKKVYLVYIARDDGYRCQFLVELKDGWVYIDGIRHPLDLIFQIENKLMEIENAVEKKIIPDREYRVAIKNGEIKKLFQKDKVKYSSNWQCTYCRWMDFCWHDEVLKYAASDNSDTFPIDTTPDFFE